MGGLAPARPSRPNQGRAAAHAGPPPLVTKLRLRRDRDMDLPSAQPAPPRHLRLAQPWPAAAEAGPADAALVAGLRRGDARAMAAVWSQYHQRIHSFLLRLCRQPELAEDLLQETFVRLGRHAAQLAAETPLLPWLYTVARNLYRSDLRKRVGWLRRLPLLHADFEARDLRTPASAAFSAAPAVFSASWRYLWRWESLRHSCSTAQPPNPRRRRALLSVAVRRGIHLLRGTPGVRALPWFHSAGGMKLAAGFLFPRARFTCACRPGAARRTRRPPSLPTESGARRL